jgi:Fic family protein
MSSENSELLIRKYLPIYEAQQAFTLSNHLAKLRKRGTKVMEFPSNLAQSVVFSANIEGNPVDYDTYLKYQDQNIRPRNKSYQEIEDLLKAYQYAIAKKITVQTLLHAHKLSTRTLLKGTGKSGNIRSTMVYVYQRSQRIYTAVPAPAAETLLKTLVKEVNQLIKQKPSLTECFYYAAMIHLRFVHIHPFADGNGRTARLLEKWFLTQCLGDAAWLIHSERYYFRHLPKYYTNIKLGTTYQTLDYDGCVPFLLMLPAALRYSYKG